MNNNPPQQHPHSVAGDFYVENQCCTSCGVPIHIAPNLIAEDESGHCYWKKQPSNRDELEQAIAVLRGQELGCHHYRGTDTSVLVQIEAMQNAPRKSGLRGLLAKLFR